MRLLDDDTLGVDAYGLLAVTYIDYMGPRRPGALFVPSITGLGEFIFTGRETLCADTGLTAEQLLTLIEWNDTGVSFREIAARIEGDAAWWCLLRSAAQGA